MQVISLYNFKGGVGKTTCAVNLAYLAAQSGLPTLIWDLDPQGSCSWYLQTSAKPQTKLNKIFKRRIPVGDLVEHTAFPRLDIIPANLSYRHADIWLDQCGKNPRVLKELIAPFSETYALLILDSPPGLSRLTENIFNAVQACLLPLIPSPLSLQATLQLFEFCQQRRIRHKHFYPFFNMADRRRRQHRDLLKAPPSELPNLLHSFIPYSSVIERMSEQHAPIATYAPKSLAATSFVQLWGEVCELNKKLQRNSP